MFWYVLQTLSDDIRLNYCRLWQSILRADVNGIKNYAEALGVRKLYPLFACIVTARSWHAVRTGVDRISFTKQEVVILWLCLSLHLLWLMKPWNNIKPVCRDRNPVVLKVWPCKSAFRVTRFCYGKLTEGNIPTMEWRKGSSLPVRYQDTL